MAKQDVRFQADLRGADLRLADLRDVQLAHADLTDADLTGARLNRAHLRAASLRAANLTNTSLREADLCGTDLRGACLDRASMIGTKLNGADLDAASLFGTDLNRSLLNDAKLDSVLSDETTRWPIRRWEMATTTASPEPAMAGGAARFGTADEEPQPHPAGTRSPGSPLGPLSAIALEQLGAARPDDPQTTPPPVPPVNPPTDPLSRPMADFPRSIEQPVGSSGRTRSMPALGCRVDSLSDPARRTDAVAAINQLITVFWRLQFSSPMTELQEAELQAQIGVLETMLRNPAGPNLVIAERAVVGGLEALQGRFDRCSPLMRSITQAAARLGGEDPRSDGLPLAQLIDLLLRWADSSNQVPEPVDRSGYLRPELTSALLAIRTEVPGDGDDEQVAELGRAILRLAAAIWER